MYILLQRRPYYKAISVACLLIAFRHATLAQQYSIVTGLGVNGKTANNAEVVVFNRGKAGTKTVLKLNDTLFSATQMIVPPKVVIKLQSTGGTQVIKSTSGQPIRYTVNFTQEGENHVVNGVGAQIENRVKKTLGYNYRNRNEKGTTAASKGTIFVFTDSSAKDTKKTSFHTSEGKIFILQKAVCTINNQKIENGRNGRPSTKSVVRLQGEGDAGYTVRDTICNYLNIGRALEYLKTAGWFDEFDPDPEEVADNRMCLGDLWMFSKSVPDAIDPYASAVRNYERLYGPGDLLTIEASLALAQAHKILKNEGRADDIVKICMENLYRQLDIELTNQQFLISKKNKGSSLFCYKIGELYNLLALAYDIQGNKEESKKYYNKQRSACK